MLAFGDSITAGASASNPATGGYAALLAVALGFGFTNHAVGGSVMHLDLQGIPSILTKMLSVPVPTRYETVVTTIGTNDMNGFGTDLTWLAAVKAGLMQGLLYLTSRRRVPEPRTEQERQMVRAGQRLPSISDGCAVYVGNTPKQVVGSYVGAASPAAQVLYAAAVADVVATVAAQGRRVYLVDVASAYNPNTMGNEPPSQIHPGDTGHVAIKEAFLGVIRP